MESFIYPSQIVVKSTTRDTTGDYGPKLKIIADDDKPYSVNKKHEALWPVFENSIGKTVLLNWGEFQGKHYIDGAQVQITAPPAPTMPVQPKEPPKVSVTPTPVIISRNLGYAMSYAKDLVMNMQLPINLMFGCAEVMRIYMDGELKVDTAPYRDWINKQDEKAKETAKPKKAS